jgi:hypothetical protein
MRPAVNPGEKVRRERSYSYATRQIAWLEKLLKIFLQSRERCR